MTSAKFIGAIDLSVRLSSMNPLGYIDLSESTVAFERSVLQALEAVWQRSENPDLLKEGIIKGGDVPKGFEFAELEDLVQFITNLRWTLLEEGLPFKICVRVGLGVGQTLEARWAPLVASLRAGEAQSPAMKADQKEAERRLGTSDPDVIERLIKLHRPLASTDNTADLHGDLEGFKGLGFHADPSFGEFLSDTMKPKFFINHFPARISKLLQPRAFVDLLWSFSPSDLVSRFVDEDGSEDEDSPATGAAAIVANVFEMMRRSLKADESNGMFYMSLLNAFVMSSSFSRLMFVKAYPKDTFPRNVGSKTPPPKGSSPVFALAEIMAGGPITIDLGSDDDGGDCIEENNEAAGSRYAVGWQNYPPIFGAILLDDSNVRLLKKSPGSEIVLGTLLDLIMRRKVETDRIKVADYEAVAYVEDNDMRGNEPVDPLFDRVVRTVERRYGEIMLRKVFGLPDAIISNETKKNALRASTAK